MDALRFCELVTMLTIKLVEKVVDNWPGKSFKSVELCDERGIELPVGDAIDSTFAISIGSSVCAIPPAETVMRTGKLDRKVKTVM